MAGAVVLSERFVLESPLGRARPAFDDVAGVIGCIPGATVTADNGDGTFAASIGVQYGETGVRLSGTVRVVSATPDAITVSAAGKDALGSLRSEGEIRVSLKEDGAERTAVELGATFTFAGVLAPLARSATRIVGPQLVKGFARCLVAKVGSTGSGR
jgi:carbon-monoxide dehydrogenase small subunit